MGCGADGDRVYEQEVARPREGEFKKNKEGGEDQAVEGRSPKEKPGKARTPLLLPLAESPLEILRGENRERKGPRHIGEDEEDRGLTPVERTRAGGTRRVTQQQHTERRRRERGSKG
jgi:hypothetical protein